MNDENIKEWVRVLRSDQFIQATGALAYRNLEGRNTFCCLGVGCKMLGLPLRFTDDDGNDVDYANAQGQFEDGDAWVDGHAPVSFHRWLGLIDADEEPSWQQSDIFLDVPASFTWKMYGETRPMRLTCAELNDGGFTFKQIADCIAYFGLERTDHN